MSRSAESTQQRSEPPLPDPDCVHCGGKGYTQYETKYDPPLRFGPDEVCEGSFTQVGCECIWASCSVCGYSYWRRDGHPDCVGFNPYAEVAT